MADSAFVISGLLRNYLRPVVALPELTRRTLVDSLPNLPGHELFDKTVGAATRLPWRLTNGTPIWSVTETRYGCWLSTRAMAALPRVVETAGCTSGLSMVPGRQWCFKGSRS